MTYLEPGVYSKVVVNRTVNPDLTPSLIPLIIGSGATEMRRTEVITRGTDTYDVLPSEAITIINVGYTAKKTDFTNTVDYELDTTDKTKINWLDSSSAKKPAEGETYCVTYTYAVTDEQYLPKVITSRAAFNSAYGSDLKEDGTINNIYVAGDILFEAGVNQFAVLQVKGDSEGNVTAEQYEKALTEYAQFMKDAWRICPVDTGDDIDKVIIDHVNSCSSYEERKERCAIFAKDGADVLTTATQVITTVGNYASKINNERFSVVYPSSATRVFSNGEVKTIGGQFVAAAYVGMEASQGLYVSKTRSTSNAFNELLGVQLTRVQKNELAEKGVMIFEQPDGPGTSIICRHQLTTNMESAEFRENSILGCKDYASKYFRNILDVYIGKYNVTADLIARITASMNSGIATLVKKGFILSGKLTSIAQDEDNPDTIILEVTIEVPYPCNYIKLTIVSE